VIIIGDPLLYPSPHCCTFLIDKYFKCYSTHNNLIHICSFLGANVCLTPFISDNRDLIENILHALCHERCGVNPNNCRLRNFVQNMSWPNLSLASSFVQIWSIFLPVILILVVFARYQNLHSKQFFSLFLWLLENAKSISRRQKMRRRQRKLRNLPSLPRQFPRM
jgi:Na+-driven multidrug efflux pump